MPSSPATSATSSGRSRSSTRSNGWGKDSMDTKDSRPPGTEQPWTIGGLLDWTARFLAQKGSEFPRLDTEVLLAHALGCRRIDLYTRYTDAAPEDARQPFRELVRQRP